MVVPFSATKKFPLELHETKYTSAQILVTTLPAGTQSVKVLMPLFQAPQGLQFGGLHA